MAIILKVSILIFTIKKAPDFSEAFCAGDRTRTYTPKAPDPKSGVSTNFTTPAGYNVTDNLFVIITGANIRLFCNIQSEL